MTQRIGATQRGGGAVVGAKSKIRGREKTGPRRRHQGRSWERGIALTSMARAPWWWWWSSSSSLDGSGGEDWTWKAHAEPAEGKFALVPAPQQYIRWEGPTQVHGKRLAQRWARMGLLGEIEVTTVRVEAAQILGYILTRLRCLILRMQVFFC